MEHIISKRLDLGFLKRDYTLEQIKEIKETWVYCGGDGIRKWGTDYTNKHLIYWKLQNHYNGEMPPHDDCVCDEILTMNCFITDRKGKILVLGNCCIERFIDHAGKLCDECL